MPKPPPTHFTCLDMHVFHFPMRLRTLPGIPDLCHSNGHFYHVPTRHTYFPKPLSIWQLLLSLQQSHLIRGQVGITASITAPEHDLQGCKRSACLCSLLTILASPSEPTQASSFLCAILFHLLFIWPTPHYLSGVKQCCLRIPILDSSKLNFVLLPQYAPPLPFSHQGTYDKLYP